MKFEKIVLEFERYETLDIIATSTEPIDPTNPTDPTQNTDPYESDKW